MKRLNPKTGLPFKRGDLREDGYIFQNYGKTQLKNTGLFSEHWISATTKEKQKVLWATREHQRRSSKLEHIKSLLKNIKTKCTNKNIVFDVEENYVLSISPDFCPVFGVALGWCAKTGGKAKQNSPSIDRIVPHLGYVKGNIQVVSQLANVMKQNATPEQLRQFGAWAINQPDTLIVQPSYTTTP